ncbi:MAG: hypothetical protein GTO63_22545 [Anaerolineae bacterium]|nr:hypothetical protein [Anaerolineae bacterium]NIN97561.1 hypothetical protein [Anaerolineae bacterium]NIQ80489.1 hypothetical protein [Anaerolineae bacterium]
MNAIAEAAEYGRFEKRCQVHEGLPDPSLGDDERRQQAEADCPEHQAG